MAYWTEDTHRNVYEGKDEIVFGCDTETDVASLPEADQIARGSIAKVYDTAGLRLFFLGTTGWVEG